MLSGDVKRLCYIRYGGVQVQVEGAGLRCEDAGELTTLLLSFHCICPAAVNTSAVICERR